ncbi:putative Sporulation sigma-E factor-processing peptidase [[Clostridium] ultunense Esp]|nr:putative Sporulation sigma-E factor-processing peptidase [[Clostridium] ultunense Esp]
MTLKVYLDLLFLINFLTDFLLLWMTAWMRRRAVKLWRLFAGALFGTLILVPLLFEPFSFLFTWVGKFFLSSLMIFIVFGFTRPSLYLSDLLFFYLITFLFGGGVMGISFFLQNRETIFQGFMTEGDFYLYPQATWLTLALGYGVMFFLSKAFYQIIQFHKKRGADLLPTTLSFFGATIEVIGLYDSGNQLYEPITRIPVVILEASVLSSILPPEMMEWGMSGGVAGYDLTGLSSLPEGWQDRFRLIPYRTVGEEENLLVALVPDWIEVRDGKNRYRTRRYA